MASITRRAAALVTGYDPNQRASARGTRVVVGAVALAAAVLASACGRPADPAAVEASAEQALKSHGAKDAAVDLQSGAFRATITQGDGREQRVVVGSEVVSAADFALPYFPGATADAQRSSRMSSGAGEVATVVLVTPEPPARVLAFYREQLQARPTAGQGPALEVPASGGAVSIVTVEEAIGRATQVTIEPAGAGSEITLLSTRRGAR
jgi:hypothetical protein